MGNISEKDIELIEKHLDNNSSPIEKKMHEEYNFLKKYKPPKINENEKKEEIKSKAIINPIRAKKRLTRFTKWFKMIYTKENEIYYNQQKITKSKTLTAPDFLDKNFFIPIHHNSDNLKNMKFIFDESITNYTLISQNQNMIELSLRKYFSENKLHFLQRVKKGPPESLRWISWMIILNIPENRNESIYRKYLLMNIEEKSDNQIKKDLNRTINENNITEMKRTTSDRNEKKDILYRVLRVLSNIDIECGYCQGINFITEFLLEISDYNEYETFYMLISLFGKNFDNNFNIRGFFINNFPLLECYLYIFDNILEKENSDIYKYIKKLEIPHEAWIGKWIQTLYTICLPCYLNYRIWDNILSTGLFFIISFSISLIDIISKDILSLKDAFDFSDYIKNFFNITYGDGTFKGSILYQVNDSNKFIDLEDLLNQSQKFHNSLLSKNIFLNLQDEFTKKKKSLSSSAIFYNINSNSNSNNLSHLNSNSNIIYSKSKSDSTKKDEENANSECDEEINELNFINLKNDNEYIFQTKKKYDT